MLEVYVGGWAVLNFDRSRVPAAVTALTIGAIMSEDDPGCGHVDVFVGWWGIFHACSFVRTLTKNTSPFAYPS